MCRFTLRDLFFVTLITALSVAWWLDHYRLAIEAKSCALWQWRAESLADGLKAHGITVSWDQGGMTVEKNVSAN